MVDDSNAQTPVHQAPPLASTDLTAPPPHKIVVIKIGSSSIMRPKTEEIALSNLSRLIETIIHLRRSGFKVVLVSSGAVAVGCMRLGLADRPKLLSKKQAVAAVGQGRLMRIYDDLFGMFKVPIAQVLLTRGDLRERHQYLNALATFRELMKLDVIPIVNENDTVGVEELRFGDNDTLSALVASLIQAQDLVLLTDVDRLYTANPRTNPDAKPIPVVRDIADLNVDCGDTGSNWGTGGMATKISAAKVAVEAGVRTIITNGQLPENIHAIIVEGKDLGTVFLPKSEDQRKSPVPDA